jgi:thioredoxin-like negative regulator of GroEL
LSYLQYRDLIDKLLADNKTTGLDQSEKNLNYAKLNQQRMHRLEKTIVLDESFTAIFHKIDRAIEVLVITEGWCGDSAQICPWFNALENESNGKIKSYYLLRDEHPEIMDRFLTNGNRAIPKFVFFDPKTGEVLALSGPRPTAIQDWFLDTKAKFQDLTKDEIGLQLHQFYTKDKGHEILSDFKNILNTIYFPSTASHSVL